MTLSDLNLSSEMSNINVPTLLVWGLHDLDVPVEMAYDAYTNLGTHSTNKYTQVYSNSAHSPYMEEPMPVTYDVKAFIEQYR